MERSTEEATPYLQIVAPLPAGSLGQRVPLSTPITMVGRRSSARLHLASSTVSKAHCLVVVTRGGAYIRDLESRSGTQVNGVSVVERELCNGDEVTVGRFTFAFVDGRPRGPLPPAGNLAVVVSPSGVRIDVTGRSALIGRRSRGVQVDDAGISTTHAALVRTDGYGAPARHFTDDGWALFSLGGKLTSMRGRPVSRAPVEHDDEIQVGGCTLTVKLEPPPPVALPLPSKGEASIDTDVDRDAHRRDLAAFEQIGDHPILPPVAIVRRLGHGGMGSVYLGQDVYTDRVVAVKAMLSQRASSRTMRRRFEREMRLGMRLRHPNLVRVHSVQMDAALPYAVMDYVEGQSLRQYVVAAGRGLPMVQALLILRDCAAGLAELHAHGAIHRDLKPDNIMLTPAGETKLLDLGTARTDDDFDTLHTQTGDTFGTPRYMAPEQFRSTAAAREPADVYSLGATFAHLLAGEPVLADTRYDVGNANAPATITAKLQAHGVSDADVVELILAMTRRDAGDRPPLPEVQQRLLALIERAYQGPTAAAIPAESLALADLYETAPSPASIGSSACIAPTVTAAIRGRLRAAREASASPPAAQQEQAAAGD